MNRGLAWTTTACALALWTHAAWGQFSSGSTGADLAYSPVTNQNILVKPGGVYNYTTVNIPANVTVNFFRNLDNSPVVILATGNIQIDGVITVNGQPSNNPGTETVGLGGAGGPGGFSGGNTSQGSVIAATSGQGPGGGLVVSFSNGTGGTYGAPTAFVGLTPLFGGSGGGASTFGSSGGGGGGAILVASSTQIVVNGSIKANGGAFGGTNSNCASQSGAGSGGAIRLVAPTIAGGGANSLLQAVTGQFQTVCFNQFGSAGRIRLEASTMTGFTGLTNPTPSIVNAPGPVSPGGNPALANVPTLAIASVGGSAVPGAPTASFSLPDLTLSPGTANPIAVVVNATNTPVGTPTEISVRLLPRGTTTTVAPVIVAAGGHTGTFASSTATANVNLNTGQVTVVQAYAAMTLTGQFASLFPLIDGEPVERVMVAANMGEASTLSLVTKSGKERRVDELPVEDQVRVARAWDAMKATRAE